MSVKPSGHAASVAREVVIRLQPNIANSADAVDTILGLLPPGSRVVRDVKQLGIFVVQIAGDMNMADAIDRIRNEDAIVSVELPSIEHISGH